MVDKCIRDNLWFELTGDYKNWGQFGSCFVDPRIVDCEKFMEDLVSQCSFLEWVNRYHKMSNGEPYPTARLKEFYR